MWCKVLSAVGPFHEISSAELAGQNFELFHGLYPHFLQLPETPRKTPEANTGSTIQSCFGCNLPEDSGEISKPKSEVDLAHSGQMSGKMKRCEYVTNGFRGHF